MTNFPGLLTPSEIRSAADLLRNRYELCHGSFFRNSADEAVDSCNADVAKCCAMGALYIAIKEKNPRKNTHVVYESTVDIQLILDSYIRHMRGEFHKKYSSELLINISDQAYMDKKPEVVIELLENLADHLEKTNQKMAEK